jgi:hypothetical protein
MGQLIAESGTALVPSDVFIVAGIGFCGWSEEGLWQARGLEETGGQVESAGFARGGIFLPSGTRDVAAGDALDWQRTGLTHDHGSSAKFFLEGLQDIWISLETRCDEMIRHKVEYAVPEEGHLGEDLALAGNPGGKNAIESGNPVRGYDQEGITKVKDFAHFAAAKFIDSGKVAFKESWHFEN